LIDLNTSAADTYARAFCQQKLLELSDLTCMKLESVSVITIYIQNPNQTIYITGADEKIGKM
jgi:hypothetical protein